MNPTRLALAVEHRATTLTLQWRAPGGLPFPMPVDVRIDGRTRRVEMPGGRATLTVPAQATVDVDPEGWVLRADQ